MDLIAFVEDHMTLLGAVATVVASAFALWRAADRRTDVVTAGIAVLAGKLDATSTALDIHARDDALRVELGFAGVNHRLDTLNGKVYEHERQIGGPGGEMGRLE